ncbi:MAG: alpha/beta hydrolase [Burkholderiales bacterium]|nr:alpha/beta hydrolase [Burkholderiales bacterium]
MSTVLDHIEIETGPNPQWTVIWMHGLGADGNDFVPIVPELGLDPATPIRFIFPHANAIPVTCNGGYVMRAWYDILELDSISRRVDEAGIKQSREAIRALIAREAERGIAADHVVLAGFSQGGAMAYSTGLTHPVPLAGIIALSTYIPSQNLIETEASAANRLTPVFAGHGTQDPIVPFMLGEMAAKTVAQSGREVVWKAWAMPHSVCMEEIEAIGQWLNTLTRAKASA